MGHCQVKPVETKVEAISDFPVLSGKRQLMHFISLAGYLRNFCNNFSIIASLLGKRVKFIRTDNCQKFFKRLRPYLKLLQFS